MLSSADCPIIDTGCLGNLCREATLGLCRYLKSSDALNDPKDGETADDIGRQRPSPRHLRHADAPRYLPCQRENGEHGSDEEQLAKTLSPGWTLRVAPERLHGLFPN